MMGMGVGEGIYHIFHARDSVSESNSQREIFVCTFYLHGSFRFCTLCRMCFFVHFCFYPQTTSTKIIKIMEQTLWEG